MHEKVKVLKKIFFAEDTGFGVFKVSVQGKGSKEHIVSGNLLDVREGDFLEIEGEEFHHPKFGKQIRIEKFKMLLPMDEEGIVRYLSSGRIKGLGRKTAEKIVRHLGLETLDILEKNPDILREIRGVRKSVVEGIRENITENKTFRQLSVTLSPYGVGNETIFKISREFGEEAFSLIKENPYYLIYKIRGIGFKTADLIAKAVGIGHHNPHRVKAGISFLLSQNEQRCGDLFMEVGSLIQKANVFLEVSEETVRDCLMEMIEHQELIHDFEKTDIVMSPKNDHAERMIARYLFDFDANRGIELHTPVDFDMISREMSVPLSDEQMQAVISAVSQKMSIIMGGPGTGKTTIIKAIIQALGMMDEDVRVAAPTGRAAKRIEETTGYQASTIHRLLKVNPETRTFVHNESNPVLTDVVIVDEFSMVDCFLFLALLKALPHDSRLILIGDKDQLPSVGPGNVMRDLLANNLFNVIHLKRNYRQTENSLIIENAYRINKGDDLILKKFAEDLDFVYLPVKDDGEAVEKVRRIVEYYRGDYPFNSPDVQILVPMYRGDAGIDRINQIFQDSFNGMSPSVEKEKFRFRQWDKVMQLKNNYEKDVFNGEQGIVAEIERETKIIWVDFLGNLVSYGPDEWDQLIPSYAVSVHKSQGSEYDMLILVMLPNHSVMLNRELFYTAVTRAKKKLFLVSNDWTIKTAVSNAIPVKRKTLLKKRLLDHFGEQQKNLDFPE